MKKLSIADYIITAVVISAIMGATIYVAWFITSSILVYVWVYLIGYPSYYIFGVAGWNFFASIWNYFLLYAIPGSVIALIGMTFYENITDFTSYISNKLSACRSFIANLFNTKTITNV